MNKLDDMVRWTALALLCGLVAAFSIHTLTSIYQDIGRHIVLGEIIWETGSIPDTNLFSYTNPDFPFINHHWLGEVFIYLGQLFAGLKGLILLKVFLLTTAFALSLFAFYRRQTVLVSLVAGLVSIFILIERTDVRPEMLSFLFLGWYLFVLYRYGDSKLLWTLPFVQILWVNTHIYFFMGPALYLAFVAGEMVRARSWRLEQRQVLAGLAIAGANFVNPFGWHGATYPLFIMKNYGYSIVENKSTFFLKAFGYPQMTTIALYIGMGLTALSSALNYKNLRANIFGLLAALMAGGLALYMVRNFPLFALVMIPVAVKNFYEAGVRWENQKALVAFCVITLSLIYSVAHDQIYLQAHLGRTFGLNVPAGNQQAIDFVRSSGLKGPIFNNFDVGSFLIWKLPEEKVFIDGRPEAYPAEFIQDIYVPMQEDPELWKKYSEQYGIRYVFWNYNDITPWSRTFVSHMVKNSDWPLVYRDGSIALFVKRGSQTSLPSAGE